MLLRSSRATFSASAISSEAISSAGRTSAGMYSRPASPAARRRRSPAMSSKAADAAGAAGAGVAVAAAAPTAAGRRGRLQRPHDDRLHDAERPDRRGELLELVGGERAPRLAPVDGDLGERELAQAALAAGAAGRGRQAPALPSPMSAPRPLPSAFLLSHGTRPPWRDRSRRRCRRRSHHSVRSAARGWAPR